jgi:hypothetical protein
MKHAIPAHKKKRVITPATTVFLYYNYRITYHCFGLFPDFIHLVKDISFNEAPVEWFEIPDN